MPRDERNAVQMVVGLGIVALGLLFAFDNLGVLDAGRFVKYWPLVLVGIGVAQIVQSRAWSSFAGALLWVLFGLWFLGRSLGLVRVGLGDLWPLLLAGAGALLVFRGWRGYGQRRDDRTGADGWDLPDDDGWSAPPESPTPPSGPGATRAVPSEVPRASGTAHGAAHGRWAGRTVGSGDGVVHAFAVIGSTARRVRSLDFRGGSATAVMGGVELDLREASIEHGDAVLDVLAFWGGIEIRVPDDWVVVPQVFPFMGGFDDRTGAHPPGTQKRLLLRGAAIMGGVEVKH